MLHSGGLNFPDLTAFQWSLGMAAAALVGFSKTGVPGTGILVVPIMAHIFGGRYSVGALLPMLIFADCFAVLWYRRHANWRELGKLVPWVVPGLAAGVVLLQWLPAGATDPMNPIIGWIVLTMLGLHLSRGRLGERLTPHSRFGVGFTGATAGFTTMVSNAAGPVMAIYFQSLKMEKREFVGTHAWYFFTFNLVKLPLFLLLTVARPQEPMMTLESLAFDLAVCPVIVLGALSGRWFLPRVNQKAFDTMVLILAAITALRLILG